MFTTEIRVGRLYEHRLGTLQAEGELTGLAKRGKEVMQASVDRVVVCADYRRVKFMKAELVNQFIAFLANVNPHIERSAIWVDPKNAIFNVQVMRIVREANNPHRKVFEDPNALRTFLAELLNPEERTRLAVFMAEPVPDSF